MNEEQVPEAPPPTVPGLDELDKTVEDSEETQRKTEELKKKTAKLQMMIKNMQTYLGDDAAKGGGSALAPETVKDLMAQFAELES